jgi:hypothetical protein
MMQRRIDEWASEHFRWDFCNNDGKVQNNIDLKKFRDRLVRLRPNDADAIYSFINR